MSNMKDPSVISKAKGCSQRKSIDSCLLEESSCTHVACQWHCQSVEGHGWIQSTLKTPTAAVHVNVFQYLIQY